MWVRFEYTVLKIEMRWEYFGLPSGDPLAWVAMIVTEPDSRSRISQGLYSLVTNFRTACVFDRVRILSNMLTRNSVLGDTEKARRKHPVD